MVILMLHAKGKIRLLFESRSTFRIVKRWEYFDVMLVLLLSQFTISIFTMA